MALNFPDNPVTGERYLASNGVEYIYDAPTDTWTGTVVDNIPGANPGPGDITAEPDFVGGDGTAQSPYLISPICVIPAGGNAQSKQLITISNQPSYSVAEWNVVGGPVSRFEQPDATFSAAGVWTGRLDYIDSPTTTVAQQYDGLFKIGTAYISWAVTQTVNLTTFSPEDYPNASPKTVDFAPDLKYGTVTGTYIDSPGQLVATGAARFSVNGGSLNQESAISQGDTLDVFFDEVAVNAAAEGDFLEGHIHGPNFYCIVPTITVDRTPDEFTVNPFINAGISSVITSDSFQLYGINSQTYLLIDSATTTLTNVEASTNGGAFVSIPISGNTCPINPGDNIVIRGTTGPLQSTPYIASLKVSTTTSNWIVTTSDAAAIIQQPTIVSPVSGSKGIVPPINLVSSTYVALNGAGDHASSDWQVYESDLLPPYTEIITDEETLSGGWNPLSGLDNGQDWQAITYGNPYPGPGKYVVVGSNYNIQNVAYSIDDGKNWSFPSPLPGYNSSFVDVAYGNEKFVAIATNQQAVQVVYSSDAINWAASPQGSTPTDPWKSVTFSPSLNLWVAVASNGAIMSSTDLVTWTARTDPTGGGTYWSSVTWGNDRFAAVSNGGATNFNRAMYSTDGINWTASNIPDNGWTNICYGNGNFVAVGAPGSASAAYSSNGEAWYVATVPSAYASSYFMVLAFGDNTFVAGDSAGLVMNSKDGINWIDAVGPTNGFSGMNGLTYGPDRFMGCMTTNPRIQWSYSGTGMDITQLTFSGNANLGTFSSGETVKQNSNGVPVTSAITGATNTLPVWFNGFNSTILSAPMYDMTAGPDGNFWTVGPFPTTGTGGTWVEGMRYGNGVTMTPVDNIKCGLEAAGSPVYYLKIISGFFGGDFPDGGQTDWYLAISNEMYPCYSYDPTNYWTFSWTIGLPVGFDMIVSDLAYGYQNGSQDTWVVVGSPQHGHGTGKCSIAWTNLLSNGWTPLTYTDNTSYKCVAYGNGFWLASGPGGVAKTGNASVGWTIVSAHSFQHLAFGNGLFVASDSTLIYYSTDGANWDVATSPAGVIATDKAVYSVEDGYWAVGVNSGYMALYSFDGKTWAGSVGTGESTPAEGHSLVQMRTGAYAGRWATVTDSMYGIKYTDGDIANTTVLTFANDTNLANLRVNDIVTETGGDATGNVRIIGNNSLTLSLTNADWDVGNTVTGPVIEASTGIFESADPFASSMTISQSTNRWLVTKSNYETDKKLNKYVTEPGLGILPPGAPTDEPPSNQYIAVVNKQNDTVNKTQYPLTDTELDARKAYYSRVKYNSDDNPVVSSDYSNYNEFSTAYSFGPDEWISADLEQGFNHVCKDVTYGDGKFVAIADDTTSVHNISYSTDGINWTTTDRPSSTSDLWAVAYGNNLFVAVGRNGTDRVTYSSDGINWTAAQAVAANSWRGVTYGDGKWVAVSYDGSTQAMYSTNGINWTAASVPVSGWTSVAYGNGKFVAVSAYGTNQAMYSIDGINWTGTSAAGTGEWRSVTYGNGRFVAITTGVNQVQGSKQVMYSLDGINWTAATATSTVNYWDSITYGDGYFVAVGSGETDRVMYSTDGIIWTPATAAENNNWSGVAYGDGKFVAVAENGTNRVMYSYS